MREENVRELKQKLDYVSRLRHHRQRIELQDKVSKAKRTYKTKPINSITLLSLDAMNAIDGFLSQRNTTLMANLQRIKPKKKKIKVPKTVSHIEHAEQSEIDLSASILTDITNSCTSSESSELLSPQSAPARINVSSSHGGEVVNIRRNITKTLSDSMNATNIEVALENTIKQANETLSLIHQYYKTKLNSVSNAL